MPIYEYRCSNCKRKVSIFWRSLSAVDESTARCTYCGSAGLSRLVSKVRVIRGGSSGDDSSSGSGAGGEADDMDLPGMEGLDENDPRSLGRFLRKMASETGENMGPEFDEVVGRLEKGEDPEKIEESMGDLFGEPPGGMDDDMGMGMPAEPAASAEDDSGGAENKAGAKEKAKAGSKAAGSRRHVAVNAKAKRAATKPARASKSKPATRPKKK